MRMTIEADAVDSGWIRIGTVTSDPLQMRESIFVNSMTESSDDTRDFRLSIHVAHDNLLVTVHILISLSLSLSLSLPLRMPRTRARATRVCPFRFACRNILNSLSDHIIKATRAQANWLRTRRESRERLARAYSRPFSKIDGRTPCNASFF